MSKKKYKHYYNSMYRFNLYIYENWPVKSFLAEAKEQYNYVPSDKMGDGVTLTLDNGNIVIWTRIKSGKSVLVHELIHAAHVAMDNKQIPINYSNTEVEAYLVQDMYKNSKACK